MIVVDDASSDGTIEVVEGLRTELESSGLALRLIRLEWNAGAANALQRGLTEASGAMICWLSADDAFVQRDKTSRQLRAMQSGAVLAYATAFRTGSTIDESMKVDAHWLSRMPRLDFLIDRRAAWRLMALLFMNPINGTSVMLRRSALAALGNFDPALGNVDADGDLWMRYSALDAQFVSTPGASVFYREHPLQISKRDEEMTAGCTRTRVRIVRALRTSGRLEGLLRESWPVLFVAIRGAYKQWPAVGQCLCESARDLRCGFFARVLLRRLEARLRKDGLWGTTSPILVPESEEFLRFVQRLNGATARRRD